MFIQPCTDIEERETGDDCIIASAKFHTVPPGRNKVHHNAVLGAEPRDHDIERNSMIIGDNNDIRENVAGWGRATHAGRPPASAMNHLMDMTSAMMQIGNQPGTASRLSAGDAPRDDCTF